jgi:hypothetical protein
MPWRGAEYEGEFATLGYSAGEWIEENIVVPDGYSKGHPFLLTDEMWTFLLHFYRVRVGAEASETLRPTDSMQHYGAQLRRPQKWGKDPFGAAIILNECFGIARFTGWDAAGEPVGAPYPTPIVGCYGTSQEQTDNTFDPILEMIRNGPLNDVSGMDAGETRVKIEGRGEILPMTASGRAALGRRLTFATLTESHLWTQGAGYKRLSGAVKRNLAGMGGRWLELTNAYDPTENSEAQVTADSGNKRVYIDNVESNRVDDLMDDTALRAELLRQYGDSAEERGGWVNLDRIIDEVRNPGHTEADRRRFFLNEIVIGQSVFVSPILWDVQARPDEGIKPKEIITLGFDGAKYQDATALVASRLSDGHLFTLGIWERPKDAPEDWQIDRQLVDAALRGAFKAYNVLLFYGDPWRWQDYQTAWSNTYPDRIVEFPTNREQLMDKAIERFMTAFGSGDITHDGHEALMRHAKGAVVVKGGRKKFRPGEEDSLSPHYLKLAKKSPTHRIDAGVAAVLAYEARAYAIEHNLQPEPEREPVDFFFI